METKERITKRLNRRYSIDVTPTWKALVPYLLILLEQDNTRNNAINELIRMVKLADKA